MEQIESRRSSLESAAEGEENGSKLNESFYSEFSQPIYGGCSGGGGDISMDISQISGWSAVNAKWDISLPLDLNFDDNASSDGNLSLCENERQEAFHTAEKASIHDLFVEECCELYNDIQNAIDELEFEEQIPCIEKLEERQHILTKKARLLAETASEFCDIVHLRMQTIDRAMEQLKLRHESESARSSSRENPHSPTYQLRQWIITLESKLEKFRADIYLTKNLSDLQRLCADQQLLQLQIETEGPSLLNFARKHLQTRPLTNGKKAERAQQSFDQLEQRFRLAWLRSLENLGRLDLKQQQGTDTPAESLSEDEEPLLKRRRTTSSSTIPATTTTASSIASPPYSRTSTTDVLLIPSSTESECATEDDPDIIPFTPGDYESYPSAKEEIMPELLLSSPSSPPGLEELCSASSRQLHDIGYSSGENSIHEALNLIGNGDFDDKERRMRLKLTPTKGFYKTVPLDDAGVTDNEGVTQLPVDGHDNIELPGIEDQQQQQMLSESMIAQPDLHSSMALPDDYQEVMEMMDDDFEARIQQLQKGTQWKELKPKRISTPKRSSKPSSETSSTKQRDTDFSCEASSEESDSGKDKYRQSLYDPLTGGGTGAAALPPLPPQQRKRRFKKAVRNHNHHASMTAGSQKSSTIMKNSLTNIGMDESVYIYPENPMSQSLSASFYGSKTPFSTSSSKRKHEKQRIHRSASDYVNLSWNLENISNSFHSFANFEPLMTSTLKRQPGDRVINRRPSVESFASTTSSGTVQETGDAHYEWDDYRDPPSLSEIMPTIVPVDDASTSSILDNTIIDEDFHNQIPFDDNIETTLHESQQSYYQVRRIMNDYDPMAEEHKDVRKALRISAKENVKKLTAIVKALPRNMNMDQINDIDVLQKDWKATLDELGPAEADEIDPNEQMEIDESTVNEIKVQLAEMKTALKQLLISDVEKMTIADLEGFITERKQIWDNLVQRKTSLKQLAEQPGNRFNNHELVHLLDIVDQSLYTIGDSTLQLEASMTKYHSMGNLQDSLEALKGKLGSGGEMLGSKTAEEIQAELELCQERMDALETVCNGLTTQLGDLAALNGNRKPGKQAKFWKELNQYKTSLKQLKEKFAKTSIKPPTPQMRKRKTKEISTNTTTVSTTSSSTTTTTTPRARPAASLPRRIAQSVSDSRTLQFLLGATALLLLGLILITYFVDDTPQNNWRRMFGPQLDYVNGAPPS